TLTDLTFSYSAEPLLEDVSLTVVDGERACLVGPNGCGKTTLLRLVTGTLVPDSGSAVVTGLDDGRCGLRPALDVLTMTGSIGSYLDAATAALRALPARFDEVATALARSPSAADQTRLAREYDHLLAAMSAADVWGLDARVEQTLTGLGLGALTGPDGRGRDLAPPPPGPRGRPEL
ncbi:ATP-binding cassette domain-containing protein, partial [Actinomyces sp. 217892]|uniref:ATP-binding cassette domain-containing protein n=1 Tax=Actinomyces sp. 217892 TaxID=2927827 RepID=UPI00202E20BF